MYLVSCSRVKKFGSDELLISGTTSDVSMDTSPSMSTESDGWSSSLSLEHESLHIIGCRGLFGSSKFRFKFLKN